MSEKHATHWLEREDLGDVTVVRLTTPRILDEPAVRDVFDPIYRLSDVGRNRLVLNFAAVDYLPSLGLGKLVMLNRKTQAGNGRLTLCGLTPPLIETLEHTRVRSLFDVYATEAEAVQSFAGAAPTAPEAAS